MLALQKQQQEQQLGQQKFLKLLLDKIFKGVSLQSGALGLGTVSHGDWLPGGVMARSGPWLGSRGGKDVRP